MYLLWSVTAILDVNVVDSQTFSELVKNFLKVMCTYLQLFLFFFVLLIPGCYHKPDQCLGCVY